MNHKKRGVKLLLIGCDAVSEIQEGSDMSACDDPNDGLKVSVIIPTLNRATYLKKTLESLITQRFSPDMFEILIIDGGSKDDTRDICGKLIRTNPNYVIHHIFEPEPGLLAGRHRGALEAKGEICTFIDDDIEASPNWLPFIYDAFKDPDIHLVGGKNIPKFETTPPLWLKNLWGTTPYGGEACGYLSLIDLGDEIQMIHPNYVWGLNFSMRKKTLFDVGGFHPDTYPKILQRFQGDGETGLTMKLSERGYQALYHPGAAVSHIIPANRMTIDYLERRAYFQGVADSYSYIRRMGSFTEKEPLSSINVMKNLVGKYALEIAKIPLSRMFAHLKTPKDVRLINRRIEHAYNEGYKFHQAHVKSDPTLLRWVLKENYWNYYLPIDTNSDEIAGTMERSY